MHKNIANAHWSASAEMGKRRTKTFPNDGGGRTSRLLQEEVRLDELMGNGHVNRPSRSGGAAERWPTKNNGLAAGGGEVEEIYFWRSRSAGG